MTPAGVDRVLARIASITSLAMTAGSLAPTGGKGTPAFSAYLPVPPSAGAPAAPVAAALPVLDDPGPLPAAAQRWSGAIRRAAADAGIDPLLLTAVVWTESSFVPDAVSPAGAVGLAQLMPGTAAALGVDPYDPDQNLAGGARYLREMLDRFGRVDLALAAYNAGPARVASLHDGGPGVPVAGSYVESVLARHRSLGGSAP
jgi:soluble lytic murein transglycosylase-like protein